MFTIDAHLDLAMNALEWNRDLRCTTAEINARELARGLADKPDRGKATVSLPDLRRGSIGLVVATQIARFTAPDNPLLFDGWIAGPGRNALSLLAVGVRRLLSPAPRFSLPRRQGRLPE